MATRWLTGLVAAVGLFAGGLPGAQRPPSAPAPPAAVSRLSPEDDAFLDDLSRRSFAYFWEQSDPATGIVRDRSRTDGSQSSDNHAKVGSIASVGFGLTGMCIAAARGWQPRDDVIARTTATLRTFAERLATEHGWFYHWLNIHTGEREWKSEVSSIDTALLMGGVLSVRQCFKADPVIPRLAEAIYRRLDFAWMRNGHPTVLSHGWRPETGMIVHRWDAYSEAMLLYVLGLGSPTSPLPPESWRAWVRPELEWEGFRYVTGAPPLFLHQYSHAWIDFRAWRDPDPPYDWFANAVTATKANKAYALSLAPRFPGYSDTAWGITASDGRDGYRAWGGPPHDPQVDGTVVPCAAAGSLMLDRALTLPALRAMKSKYGARLYGRYGFADAFHPTANWINPDVIGIDVGITLLSAENARTGRVWQWFMANPEIRNGLKRAGLTPASNTPPRRPPAAARAEYMLMPQPGEPQEAAARQALASLAPLAARFDKATFAAPNGVSVPYRLLAPASLKAGATYPLVVVFHGAGEMGTDNEKQLTGLALAWARDATRAAFPAYVLAPQMPARSAVYSDAATADRRESEPGPPLHAALALIDRLAGTLPVDRSRIYAVGFSMGASTAWNALNLRPSLFAAAVAAAGVPNAAHAVNVAKTPLWIVHGNRDDTNPIRHDRRVYRPLADAGGLVRFWEMDLLDHRVPPTLLADDAFATWLWTHRR